MDRYQEGILRLEQHIDRLKEVVIPDHEAKALIFDVFAQAILPVRLFRAVGDAYFWPPGEAQDLQPRTMWSLYNALTRQARRLTPGPAFQATIRLGRLFSLGHPVFSGPQM